VDNPQPQFLVKIPDYEALKIIRALEAGLGYVPESSVIRPQVLDAINALRVCTQVAELWRKENPRG